MTPYFYSFTVGDTEYNFNINYISLIMVRNIIDSNTLVNGKPKEIQFVKIFVDNQEEPYSWNSNTEKKEDFELVKYHAKNILKLSNILNSMDDLMSLIN